MKAIEVRTLSDVDLKREVENSYREIFNLRFRLATNQLTNHRELRNVRRNIARFKTIIKERELAKSEL
ncbi:MAG: 50S ribosomal protein L29 [Chloroflexi bacterium]|nr:50S ribosomal protein L29 [Chloroflexota bacterium]MCH9037708.1 50S ribosomal protein L29 [Chloroflexota bacterium]